MMPIVIGGKPESTFNDPVGLLRDCHRRIERFLGVLVHVAGSVNGAQLSGEQRSAWENALRYFREAAPKHTADEEESLFPRMRANRAANLEAALVKVQALEQDHDLAAKLHEEVDVLGRKWLGGGQLKEAESRRLSDVLAELTQLYRRHIAVEDGEVFPAADAALTPEERSAIGKEMSARRGVA